MIVVLDFGSQYTQLIARRVRECRVYSEIIHFLTPVDKFFNSEVEGIILSGGPGSVYQADLSFFKRLFELPVPMLGICYGMQLGARILGGRVKRGRTQEYGLAHIRVAKTKLFNGLPRQFNVWMSHGDIVVKVPEGVKILGSTETTPIAGFQYKKFYGLQFHPEVKHTEYGIEIIDNFLSLICRAKKTWSMRRFINKEILSIKEQVGNARAICAISGGIDSAVCAAIAAKALGSSHFVGIFVDNGLLRAGEREEVKRKLAKKVKLRIVDARERFLSKLKGVRDPEKKRKIIGREFIRVFEAEAKKYPDVKFLVQGTLYPDVIESGRGIGPADVIKSHHNVGGLPKRMSLKVVEPLRLLFKDEVKNIARLLKLPGSFIQRKPFPGPGLAVRIIGEVTPQRLDILRQADKILQEEAIKLKIYPDIWQIFAVLLPLGSVGVMGDKRTYDAVCAIRAVYSDDGMTADWVHLPDDFLGRVSRRITNEVRGINRVVYDITSKPPATIEWE